MENITFETTGLLIGMIGYPFDIEGVKFFRKEFKESLFESYKNNIANRFGKDQKEEYKKLAVFKPIGYHLFGSYNLAVLSLIDGYAFGNRVFHPGHENLNENTNNYRYQVLTGVGCKINEKEDYLHRKAELTFLKTSERYPYIGITRLKLNNSLLIGSGMNLMQAIRMQLEVILGDKSFENNIEAFTIDTFGSSEIVLVSFADSLMKLHRLIAKIKSWQIKDIISEQNQSIIKDSLLDALYRNKKENFHVFSGAYTHLGYDLEWEKNKTKFLRCASDKRLGLKMQFRWEFKPGHDHALCEIKEYYEKKWSEKVHTKWQNKSSEDLKAIKEAWQRKTWIYHEVKSHLTGANVYYLSQNFDLKTYREYIRTFFKKLKLERHLRSLRTHLYYMNKPWEEGEEIHKDYEWKFGNLKISEKDMNCFRAQLVKCGISKLTKERIMKMFARFNEYIQNRQTYIYFIELRGYLLDVIERIDFYAEHEAIDIEEIDRYLTDVIAAFDGAFFNRFHQSVREGAQNDITLEYNGGMQQYASSFTLIFKEALQVLNSHFPEERSENAFVYISGYESVISQREIMRINMNLITFPELFAISIYKEAGNFIIEREKTPQEKSGNNIGRNLEKWHNGLYLKTLPENFQKIIRHAPFYRQDCTAHRYLAYSLNIDLIKYFLADVHNLYFGFNGDYDLLHYFYWKYLLQLSNCYKRNGEVKVEDFISLLLRLIMIQYYLYQEDSDAKQKISTLWKERIFDPRLKSLWKAHFTHVLDIGEVIWNSLKSERFHEFLEEEIYQKIYAITGEDYTRYRVFKKILLQKNIPEKDINESWYLEGYKVANIKKSYKAWELDGDKKGIMKFWKDIRDIRIQKLENDIKSHHLICEKGNEVFKKIFISDMLIAYLRVVHQLDNPNDGSDILKVLIRNQKGEAYDKDDKLNSSFSPLLSDPQGGFYTHGLKQRSDYFCYRTLIYRSLWNYSIRKKKEKILEIIRPSK